MLVQLRALTIRVIHLQENAEQRLPGQLVSNKYWILNQSSHRSIRLRLEVDPARPPPPRPRPPSLRVRDRTPRREPYFNRGREAVGEWSRTRTLSSNRRRQVRIPSRYCPIRVFNLYQMTSLAPCLGDHISSRSRTLMLMTVVGARAPP
ncbi:hypothetical protein EVAR_29031_1 [Eumeta japonica]|uniref:Uncharacterized protein n=1 Tax=Eumeta variegata TaxID=151549 RepID=A0A4C1W2L9_EUMVA|nr:hypothetical protein EVAR_29031_1 [Eumeta japonica]